MTPSGTTTALVSPEHSATLAAVLAAVRDGDGVTEQNLVDELALGRGVVAQRVATLQEAGLIDSHGAGSSTRPRRRLRLGARAGHVLGVDIGAREVVVGLADLTGTIRETRHEEVDCHECPDVVVAAVRRLVATLLDDTGSRPTLRAAGVGMPGPVSPRADKAVSLPTLPEWSRYPTRERLAGWWGVPVWMEDRVKLAALGERRADPVAAASRHLLYLGEGATLGAAVVLDGVVHRGGDGLAGAIGHVPVPEAEGEPCRCGSVGCLETVAGTPALLRDARLLAEDGRSPTLAAALAASGTVTAADLARVAADGDVRARALLTRSALALGGALAQLVNAYNPDLVVVGAGGAGAQPQVLAAIRAEVYRRAMPAATLNLRIEPSGVDAAVAGVTGAAHLVLERLFSADHLPALLRALPPR